MFSDRTLQILNIYKILSSAALYASFSILDHAFTTFQQAIHIQWEIPTLNHQLYHIKVKVKCDHRSKFSNLSNWKEEAWKKSGLQRDSNPWPPRYRCDALPTELWSHTLGARSIYWVHFFPCSEIIWNIYEINHICTAVWDESEVWSSQ